MNVKLRYFYFLLSKENIDLAVKEVLTLIGNKNYSKFFVDENLLIVKTNLTLDKIRKFSERLAYTNSIGLLLLTLVDDTIELSDPKMWDNFQKYFDHPDLYSKKPFDFKKYLDYKFSLINLLDYYSDSFRLRKVTLSKNSDFPLSEKEFSEFIYSRLSLELSLNKKYFFDIKKSFYDEGFKTKKFGFNFFNKKNIKSVRVDLKNPVTKFILFNSKKVSYFSLELFEVKKDYLLRNSKFFPARLPITLKPKLSRVMINLLGLNSGVIFDPFCGIGGILIEAGFMGFKLIGSDISSEMINKTKINLDYFNLSAKLYVADACQISVKSEGIVTDLPYGKNTKNIGDIGDLFERFLIHYEKISSLMVVGIPDNFDYKSIIDKTLWNIDYEFSYYLHKTLNKRIIKLVK